MHVRSSKIVESSRMVENSAHLLLDERDGLAWVEALRTGLGAIHDGVATIQLEGVVEGWDDGGTRGGGKS